MSDEEDLSNPWGAATTPSPLPSSSPPTKDDEREQAPPPSLARLPSAPDFGDWDDDASGDLGALVDESKGVPKHVVDEAAQLAAEQRDLVHHAQLSAHEPQSHATPEAGQDGGDLGVERDAELDRSTLSEPKQESSIRPPTPPTTTEALSPSSPIKSTLFPSTLPSNSDDGPPMDDFDDLDDPPPDDFDDEFDDFGDAAVPGQPGDGDDDDGFGDFEETSAFDTPVPPVQPSFPFPAASSSALKLDLEEPVGPQLEDFLEGLYPFAKQSVDPALQERQVDGPGQVLVTEESRHLLTTLSSLPPLRPLDWRRSKIRRSHLTALGVPINLDDSAETHPLPSLSVSTSSSSPHPHPSSRSPTTAKRPPPPPLLDLTLASSLLAHTESSLSLLPLSTLQTVLSSLHSTTEAASNSLTRALMERERLGQDGETYNRMIQDLVRDAARMKASASGVGAGRGRWGRRSSPAGSVR